MINKYLLKQTSAACALAVMGALGVPTVAVANQQVTLKSSDGTVNIVGDFVAFEDNNYVVNTGLGDLRISAARVRCEGEACPEINTGSADVVIAGSDTVGLGLMPLLIAGYASHLDADAEMVNTATQGEIIANFIGDAGFGEELGSYMVSSTSSGDAFRKLLDGSSQIGMSSRRIKPQEARELKRAGFGNMVSPNQEHIVAVDSLVVITHPDNPLDTLSKEQLRDIYTGRVTNWSELGGDNVPITVIARQEGSGTRSVFEDAVFLGNPATLDEDVVIADDNNKTAALVNEDAGAIGYVGYAFQRGAQPMTIINHCGMPMKPDAFSAKTEEYALQRRLYLYTTDGELPELAKDFMNYAQSDAADGVITKSGFINLGVEQQEQPLDGPRARALLSPDADAFEAGVMREMLGKMVDYNRLSTTFRFRTGSSRLDERGRIDMERLVEYLEQQPEGTEIMFVGFTDNVGAFEANRNLSRDRAAQVQQTIADFAGNRISGIDFTSEGYGEIAPAYCNNDENGRAINRRVEVWIKPSNT